MNQDNQLVLSGRTEIVSSSEGIIKQFVEKRSYFTSRQEAKNLSNNFEEESDEDESLSSPRKIRSPGRQGGKSLMRFLQLRSLNIKGLNTFQSIKKEGFSDIWKRGALRIIYLISKFLQMLKTSTDQYKFKLITPKIFSILGDKASDFQFYQLNGYLKDKPGRVQKFFIILFEFLRRNFLIKISVGIIKPDSLFKIYFDVLVLILIVMNLLYIPMKLSFDLQDIESQTANFFLDTLPSIIFIVEILMNFNTAYYSEGIIHENRKQIMRHYLNDEFIWDAIVVVPFLISRFNIPYIDFVLLLRVKSVKRIIENVEEATSIREKFAGLIDLCKLISFLMFTNHICACIWHYLGRKQLEYSDSSDIWIIRYNMIDHNWVSRYIYCFYWSTITTLTVGYGDIVPGNDIERVVSIVIVLICSIVFGYTLTSIGSIFTQMKEKNDKFKNNMAEINSYIKQHKLNKQLQMKVRKYFEYYFKSQEESNEECQQLMDKLSPDLKKEVNRDIFKKILQRSKIVTETFSEAFINELCEYMKLKHFLPGDLIFQQNMLLNQLLFLTKGEMQVFVERQVNLKNTTRIHLRTYQKGYVIGTKNFFQNKCMEFSSKATKFVEIAYLQYEDFINILRGYPEDYEKFAILRDNLVFNRKFNKVVDVCAICSSNHQLMKCPFGFYQVNRYKLISEKRQLIQNQRNPILRLKKQSQNIYVKEFFKNRGEIQNGVIEYCIENEIFDEEDLTSDYEKKLGLTEIKSQQDIVKEDSFQMDESEQSNQNDKGIVTHKFMNSKKDIVAVELFGVRKMRRRSVSGKKTHVSFKQTEEVDCASAYPKKKIVSARSLNEEHTFLILDIVSEDYKQFIKEDSMPGLDRYFNYNMYNPMFNCQNILAYLKEIIDENCQVILKNLQKKKFKKNNNLKLLMAKRNSRIPKATFQMSFVG